MKDLWGALRILLVAAAIALVIVVVANVGAEAIVPSFVLLVIFVVILLSDEWSRPTVQHQEEISHGGYIAPTQKTDSKPATWRYHHEQRVKVSQHGHRCYIDTKLTSSELDFVRLLAQNLDHKKYFIFNNLIIPSHTLGTTTQIDHVVVSRYGVFVIENKDFKGWIFANTHHKKWTQTLPRWNGTSWKNKFQNPLLQNFAHVCSLKDHLPFIKKRYVFSAVVFSDAAEFKSGMPPRVFYQDELIDFILSKTQPLLKEEELLIVIGKLSMLCQTVDVTPEEHAQNVQARLEARYGRGVVGTRIPARA